MKILLKILKWLIVVFVTLAIVMFAINWSDQTPSSAAVEMRSLLDEGSEVSDRENAFVYAMGFVAPQGDDPVRSGSECIAKLNAAVHKQTINFNTDTNCKNYSSFGSGNAAISNIFDVCRTPGNACENALNKNEQTIAQWLNDGSWLLERYTDLLNHRKWHSTTEFSIYMTFPYYGSFGDAQKMLLFKAWHLAGQGDSAEVLRLLNRDVRFWRMVMSSSSTLLDKMIATGFLARHFTFSNLVLRRLFKKGYPSVVPTEWLAPFSGDELSLKKAMAGEWAFFASAIQEARVGRTLLIDESDSPDERSIIDTWLQGLSNYFLLPQATLNAHAEVLLRLAGILNVPANRLP